jgi:hypothetical protein
LTRLQSGLILNPSLGERFVTEWTSSLAVTHANHSQPQENDSAQTIPDTSGHSSQMEFGFFDQNSASLKMSKDTSPLDSEKSLANWNQWVTKCRGEYSARVKLAHHINANEFSSFPTVTANEDSYRIGGESQQSKCLSAMARRGELGHPAPVNPNTHGSRPESWETPTVSTGGHRQADGSMTPKLDQQVKSWATPQQRGFKDPESLAKWTARAEEQKAKGVNLHLQLPSQVMHNEEMANWPTPNCMDTLPPKSQEALDRNREKGGCSNLREWVHHEGTFQMPQTESVWPTPEAYVVRGPIPTEFVDGKFVSLHGEVKYGAKIADAVRVMESWATPRAGCPGSRAPGTGGKVLEEQVRGGNWATPRSRDAGDWMMNKERLAAGMPEDTLTGQATQSNKGNGKLNPRWVEILMNLPIGWTMPSCQSPVTIEPTNCACSATESCQQPQP